MHRFLEIRNIDGNLLYKFISRDGTIISTRKDPRNDLFNNIFEKGEEYVKSHFVKCINPFFNDVWEGRKTFEIRFNDRCYKEGDYVILREYDPTNDKYSGALIIVKITYLIEGTVCLKEGYCAFSIEVLWRHS